MTSLSLTPVPVLPSNAAVYDVPYFNVKDTPYTAKGDGSTADDVAIQAAINACGAAGGGTVLLPPGTYILNTYLTISSSKVKLRGEGAILKLGSGFTRGSQGQGHIFINGVNDVNIEGVRFDGNSGTISADATNNFAIWATNAARVSVNNCYVTGCNTGGSNANAAFVFAGTCDYAKFIGNTFENCGGGAIFTQGHDCLVANNSLLSCNDVGIVFNGSACYNCTATGNTINTIPSQCAFGVENGAHDWTIVGNAARACFGALDINDAGYAGSQVSGGVFANNQVVDMDKVGSIQTITVGVLVRSSKTRNIKIVNNIFSGLTAYATNDSFVFVDSNSEGLEIRNNVFESKAQAGLSAIIFIGSSATHTRCVIDGNIMRSTSSVTKMSKGIWLQASGVFTETTISRNYFENITNQAVHFDTSVSFTGALQDNRFPSGVGTAYGSSPWGTIAPGSVVTNHLLTKVGRSVWWGNAAPTTGTWVAGDQTWNFATAAAGVPGWVCTTGGTPGTWKAMAAVAA